MTQNKDHPRTAESRSRAGGAPRRRPGVLTDHPTSPRENPPADSRRIALAREDWSRVVGN
jgi:hypothetical protein